MLILLQIVLWYLIFGCIAIFGYLRKYYLLDKADGYCDGVLDFLQFDELPFSDWFFQMLGASIAFLVVWPSLLRSNQPPLTIEVEYED